MAKKQRRSRTRKKKASKRDVGGSGSAAAEHTRATAPSGPSRRNARRQARHGAREQLPAASSVDVGSGECAEDSVRHSEELFRASFEQATNPIVLADAKTGRVLEFNEPAREAIGCTRQELGRLKLTDLLGDEVSERMAKDIEEVLKHGSGVFDVQCRSAGGELRDIQTSYGLLSVSGGECIQLAFVDITTAKQARERLHLLSSGVEQVTEGIALARVDGMLVYVNSAFAAMHGYSPEEVVGKHLSVFHTREQMPSVEAANRELLETGSFSGEIWHARRDGSLFPGRMCNAVFRDESGVIVGMIATLRDITAQKQAEEALQTAHTLLKTQVQQSTTALVEANQQLKREIERRKQADEQLHLLHTQLAHMGRVSTMGEMASGLAHELNQPLCAVTTYAQACLRLLNSEAGLAELEEPLREVAAEAKRAGEMIRRLRGFVRRAEPCRVLTDVNRLIPEVAQFVEHEIREHEISMHFDLAHKLPPVMVDAIQIQQVILNLVRNSIQVLAEDNVKDREIRIRTAASTDGTVLVTVRDSGPTISHEIADQIFEPFFSTKSDGLGMGLPLSRSIIEEHGGCIWFARCPDRGSMFQFTLPVQDGY